MYVATHLETAVAEVRPWQGAYVSVAQLETARELRIINCTTEHPRTRIYFAEPDAPTRELEVWKDIDEAFAWPVTAEDDRAEYAHTQLLAEVFKESGLDGVAYRSSLGEGHNIALFDLNSANIVNRSLREITSVKYGHKQAY